MVLLRLPNWSLKRMLLIEGVINRLCLLELLHSVDPDVLAELFLIHEYQLGW